MSAIKFFDTNILVYAYDLKEPIKRPIALSTVESGWANLQSCAISVQVLQEMFVALLKRGVSRAETKRIVHDFEAWPIIDNTLDLFRRGLKEADRWNLSLWDGLILAAARESKATELISEDFNEGQVYDGIRVVNPFRVRS